MCPCSLNSRTVLETVAVQFRPGHTLLSLSEGKTCTKTRHSFAKNADRNSYSQRASRSSMRKRVSRTNPRDAKNAARPERLPAGRIESTSPPPAPPAAPRRKYPSSPEKTDPYIAANALQSRRSRKPINAAYACIK